MNYHVFTKNSKLCTWNKIDTQSRADAYNRRKSLISKSVYKVWMHLTKSILETKKPQKLSLLG